MAIIATSKVCKSAAYTEWPSLQPPGSSMPYDNQGSSLSRVQHDKQLLDQTLFTRHVCSDLAQSCRPVPFFYSRGTAADDEDYKEKSVLMAHPPAARVRTDSGMDSSGTLCWLLLEGNDPLVRPEVAGACPWSATKSVTEGGRERVERVGVSKAAPRGRA
eukprot:scaffold121098_cov22-Tisochrysis_lutea.AAC.1